MGSLFSRREREFLVALSQSQSGSGAEPQKLVVAFPNPIYRRKMMWGIRRKAARAAADWELYLRAATVDGKIVPGGIQPELPPLAADPLVTIARRVRRALRTTARANVDPPALPVDNTRVGGRP